MPLLALPFRRDLNGEQNGLSFIIPTSDQGYPLLPTHWHPQWTAADKREFFRSFVTMRYREQARITTAHHTNHASGAFCNNSTIKVPWTQVGQENNKWLSKGSAPHGYLILDPSKMGRAGIDVVFHHWIERAKKGLTAFSFIHSSLVDKSNHRPANEHIREDLVSPEVPLGDGFGQPNSGDEDTVRKGIRRNKGVRTKGVRTLAKRKPRPSYAEVDLDDEDFTQAIRNVDDLDDGPSSDGGDDDDIVIVPSKRTRKQSGPRNTQRKPRPSTPINDEEYEGSMSDKGADSNDDSSDGASDSGLDDVSPKGKGKGKGKAKPKPKTLPKPKPKPRRSRIPPSPSQDSFDGDDLRRAMEASLRQHRGQGNKPGSPSGRPRSPSLREDPLPASSSREPSRGPPTPGRDQVAVTSPRRSETAENTSGSPADPKARYPNMTDVPKDVIPPLPNANP